MPSKELVVSQNRHETKAAILEDGQLVEIYFQRANEYSLAGSIHKGRVTRVLPGMQSAFVDLGLERDCFLYVSDFFEENADEFDRVPDDRRSQDRGRGRETPAAAAEAPTQAAPAEPAPAAETRERRSRRTRRRRRSGRGLPESKFATLEETASEPAAAESQAEAGVEEEIVLLPGESLAKYRRRQEEAAQGEAVAPLTEQELEEAAEEAAEKILDRVEALEHGAAWEEPAESGAEPAEAPVDLPAEAGAEAPAVEEAAEEEIAAAETQTEEPVGVAEAGEKEQAEGSPVAESAAAAGAAEEAPEAEGEAEAGAAAATEAAAVAEAGEEHGAAEGPAGESEEEGGVEPARMPVSLTATLRAQGAKAPHRITRRSRRRGRDRAAAQAEPAAESRGEEAAPAVEVRQPAPERREPERGERERERPPQPSITDLLKEGQEIIVQIAKEPLGQKGARITSHIALPGRYVVYMPTVEHLGVSRRISTDEERQRLRRILQKHREGIPGGFIMRTAGEGRSEEEIAADMRHLAALWLDIKQKAEKKRAPALLHHDVEIVQRIIRDQLTEGFKAIWVDSEELYEQVLHNVERFQPELLNRVKLYTRPEPIFDAFGITQELEKALKPKVWLKSGGYIVINQTEALVAIDVNTGKFVGKSNRLEDTIVKTNLEAIKEIVRQIRLRDLGGIIVVDFIDMEERKNRQKVMQALEEAMRQDKAPYKILQFNDFGLVAITRKRVKQSLERTLCSPCPTCEGAGYVKSVTTVIGEILTEAAKYAKVVDTPNVVLRVHPDVARELKSTANDYLEELEEILGRPVVVTPDPLLHPEKFDMA
ncbi:MAG: Rne/Rng family ribonuclease [Bryobacteraceae bacterium]|nr:Rne/Rng family ribonuclease [Bryobacteraceae bacterium]